MSFLVVLTHQTKLPVTGANTCLHKSTPSCKKSARTVTHTFEGTTYVIEPMTVGYLRYLCGFMSIVDLILGIFLLIADPELE